MFDLIEKYFECIWTCDVGYSDFISDLWKSKK